MTDAELNELEKLCAQATPGPWVCDEGDDELCSSISGVVAESVLDDFTSTERWAARKHRGDFRREMPWIAVVPGCESVVVDDRNFAFIAASRTAVPTLIAEVRRLRAEVERLSKTGD